MTFFRFVSIQAWEPLICRKGLLAQTTFLDLADLNKTNNHSKRLRALLTFVNQFAYQRCEMILSDLSASFHSPGGLSENITEAKQRSATLNHNNLFLYAIPQLKTSYLIFLFPSFKIVQGLVITTNT